MPKVAKPLTVREIETKRRAGMFADQHGLYLHVSRTGAKSWIFRYTIGDRRRDMGLGALALYPLAEAREMAIDLRRKVRAGIDPLGEKVRKAHAPKPLTFRECAGLFIDQHRAEWRDGGRGWEAMLTKHAYPTLGERRVADIGKADIIEALSAIWTARTSTASTLRNKIELVMAYAMGCGFRAEGPNPAAWRGNLDAILPDPRKIISAAEQHHEALDYRQLPQFMRELRAREGLIARAVELTILCAARVNEVREARWSEFDLDGRVWNVPGSRMKSGKPHRRALGKAAVDLLRRVREMTGSPDSGALVFPGIGADKPLRKATYNETLQRFNPGITMHGFRSTFRDWAAELQPNIPAEVAELALSHAVGNAVAQAYARSDRFALRVQLADAFGDYCDHGAPTAEVVPMRRPA